MPTLEILTFRTDGFVGMHIAGFEMFRRALRTKLDLWSRVTLYGTVEQLRSRIRESDAQIVMVLADWRVQADELSRVFGEARDGSSARRLVFFDWLDGTNSPYLSILPVVDAYVKSKCLWPVERYLQRFDGGYIFTNFCSESLGWQLDGWEFGSIAPAAYLNRIVPGWSFGASRGLRLLLRLNRLVPRRLDSRPIDLHVRITPPERVGKEWYERYRAYAAAAVAPLRQKFRTTPTSRISLNRYRLEMRKCRVVFSPFGWGELCLRDYEAICSGCILVKPDMSHMKTSPDVFIAGETYAPVRWDLSDLEDVCERYLASRTEGAKMANAAQAKLYEYYEFGGFLADVRRLLESLSRVRSGES